MDETVNTENKPELAGAGSRIAAYLIDTVIMILFLVIIAVISIVYKMGWLFVFAWIAFLLLPLYYVIFEMRDGQSPGKKFLKIKVVDKEFKNIDFVKAFIRNITKAIPFWPIVGVLLIALTENRQRLGDMLAGTLVIKINPGKD